MAEEKKTYQGVPLGAVFEACQKTLRELKFSIKREDISDQEIVAKSGMTMNSFGQEITLRMSELGEATELSILTSTGQLIDWGEGNRIIKKILSQNDVEIERIRADGRISPVEPKKFSFGEPPLNDYSKPKSRSGQSASGSGVKIAVGIIGITLSLMALMQSCAITGLSGMVEDQETGEAGALGMMTALLMFFGGAFAFGLPRVAQVLFLLAFVVSIPARENFSDMWVWGIVSAILAGLLVFQKK